MSKNIKYELKTICRFCFQIVDEAYNLNEKISTPDGTSEITLFEAFTDVLPEISLNLQKHSMTCFGCIEKLKIAFSFRKMCLQTELDIAVFAAHKGINISSAKLVDVFQEKLRSENDMRFSKLELTENYYKSKSRNKNNNIEDIINNIPEIDDAEDVPDLIDPNNLEGDLINNITITKEAKKQSNNAFMPPITLSKVIPVKPYVLKESLLYPCKFCNRAFKNIYRLEHHMGEHPMPASDCALCVSCRLHVPKKLMKQHVNLHEKQLMCAVCKLELDIEEFLAHMKSHYPANYKTFPAKKLCGVCYHFLPMAFFRLHLEFHKMGVPVVSTNNLRCQICSEVFDFSGLIEHMKLHSK